MNIQSIVQDRIFFSDEALLYRSLPILKAVGRITNLHPKDDLLSIMDLVQLDFRRGNLCVPAIYSIRVEMHFASGVRSEFRFWLQCPL